MGRVTLIRHPPLAGDTFPQGKARAFYFWRTPKIIRNSNFSVIRGGEIFCILAFPWGKVARPSGVTDEGHPTQFRFYPSDRKTQIYNLIDDKSPYPLTGMIESHQHMDRPRIAGYTNRIRKRLSIFFLC